MHCTLSIGTSVTYICPDGHERAALVGDIHEKAEGETHPKVCLTTFCLKQGVVPQLNVPYGNSDTTDPAGSWVFLGESCGD